MARARGANTGFAVALVIFGCGFVIATLVAIIFYTKIETHKNAEIQAKDELAKYVKPAETGPANDFIGDGRTMYANMKARIDDLDNKLNNNDTGALTQIKQLEAQIVRKDTQYDSVVSTKSEVEARLEAEREQFTSIMNQRQDQIDDLINEKDALATQIGELQQKVTAAIANADQAAQARIVELNEQVTALQGEQVELEDKIRIVTLQRNEAIDKLPELPEPNTTLPDGRVASVFGAGNDLFITLGRRNGIVMGMTFEVFDPDPVIRLNTQGDARGKATVEVYGLDDDSATCRVVRLERGEQIDPEDPIVNIGYDPNMDITMYASGFFDIEGDGGTNDLSRINALIIKSSAEIPDLTKNDQGVPILSPDLDYIVLGTKPVLPDPPGDDVFDPQIIANYQAKLAEVEAYFSLTDQAKQLRIPVLNQNRFLDLIGYYVR